MKRLKERVTQHWSTVGLAPRMWWASLTAVGIAAALVLTAATVVDASSPPAPTSSAEHAASSATHADPGSSTSSAAQSGSGSASGSMAGMPGMSSPSSAGSAPRTNSAVCSNVKGASVMSDGMVMAPVPTGSPTAAQQAAANQLVVQTTATLARFSNLSAATAAGYVPTTDPNRYTVHYANWAAALNDGFDPSDPAFLVYANTVNGPVLLGAMYLGPSPCTPGPDIGGSLTQWHAHDNLCLSGGQVVGRTSASGTCGSGSHNTNAYFMLHVWTEPSLASTHQFQADLTRAELAPIIQGTA